MNFPKPINEKLFFGLIIACYACFCIDPEFSITFNFSLFKNDLNDVVVVNWLLSQLIAEIFIFLLSWQACANTSNRLIKSIFYAIMLDSLFTALFAVLFGYSPSVGILLLRNSFTCLAMYYAYYILHKGK
jgi:hypothetical protein